MPYLSFSCFSLHSTSTLDSLHLSRQILDVRGRKKKHLHILDSPVDQYKSFFFRVGNYRETRNWEDFQDFFKSEVKGTLISQQLWEKRTSACFLHLQIGSIQQQIFRRSGCSLSSSTCSHAVQSNMRIFTFKLTNVNQQNNKNYLFNHPLMPQGHK